MKRKQRLLGFQVLFMLIVNIIYFGAVEKVFYYCISMTMVNFIPSHRMW